MQKKKSFLILRLRILVMRGWIERFLFAVSTQLDYWRWCMSRKTGIRILELCNFTQEQRVEFKEGLKKIENKIKTYREQKKSPRK